jgi:hypothetical protein
MKILFATDGGAPAQQALALLERVAAPEKTEVTVVTVGRSVKSMVEGVNLAPEDILGSVVTRLRDTGLAADQRLLDGRPAQAILEEITQGGFEVTVLGAGKVPD